MASDQYLIGFSNIYQIQFTITNVYLIFVPDIYLDPPNYLLDKVWIFVHFIWGTID